MLISTATLMPGVNGIVALLSFTAVSSSDGDREDEAFRFEYVACAMAEDGRRHGVQSQDVVAPSVIVTFASAERRRRWTLAPSRSGLPTGIGSLPGLDPGLR